MKSELDGLMRQRGLDAIVIWVDDFQSAPFDYLTGGAHVTRGLLIRRADAPAVLYASSMETEEAARSGLEVHIYNGPELAALVSETGDAALAAAHWWGEVQRRCGITTGTVGLYGSGDIAFMLTRAAQLREICPEITFVGEPDLNLPLFSVLYETKDADELLRLRSVAARTDQVLQATWDFIASHHAEGDRVVSTDGEPLTIGAVKRFVRRTLLDYDLEDTGMIFAQGRDAGFPHSRGEADMELRTGQSIIFDLFPREIGGGYFHDVTRTWSIGHASEQVQQAYEQVLEAFDIAQEFIRPGMPASAPQNAVLDYFERRGHQSLRSHPGTQQGYVHSLGHGIGLTIHESPGMSHVSKDTLRAGNVITIEPGLYYPEEGFGVRVEDACYIDDAGTLIPLTTFRKDLVLPLQG